MAPWPKQQLAQESRGGAWQPISQVQVWALSCECGTPSFQRSVTSTLSCIQRPGPISSKLSAPKAHFCRSGQRNWRSILDPHFGSLCWIPILDPVSDPHLGCPVRRLTAVLALHCALFGHPGLPDRRTKPVCTAATLQAKAASLRDLRMSLILCSRKDFAAFAQRAIRPSSR